MSRTQFTLIERPEYHPTAVSATVLADMLESGEVITSQAPITKARIKAERVHVLDDEHYFKMKAFEVFKAKYTDLVFKAKVLWFDRLSGEGYAEGLNGEGRWPLYACNISGKKTWYPGTACVYHEKDQVIDAEIKVFISGSLLVSHTPGILDEDKWNSLDQNNLAFKCNEAGEAVTGLFTKGVGL